MTGEFEAARARLLGQFDSADQAKTIKRATEALNEVFVTGVEQLLDGRADELDEDFGRWLLNVLTAL